MGQPRGDRELLKLAKQLSSPRQRDKSQQRGLVEEIVGFKGARHAGPAGGVERHPEVMRCRRHVAGGAALELQLVHVEQVRAVVGDDCAECPAVPQRGVEVVLGAEYRSRLLASMQQHTVDAGRHLLEPKQNRLLRVSGSLGSGAVRRELPDRPDHPRRNRKLALVHGTHQR